MYTLKNSNKIYNMPKHIKQESNISKLKAKKMFYILWEILEKFKYQEIWG